MFKLYPKEIAVFVASLALVLGTYQIFAAGESFVIELAGGDYIGEYPEKTPSNISVDFKDPSEGGFSRQPDGELFERCGPDGYGCNFLHKDGLGILKNETYAAIDRNQNKYLSRIKKKLDELDSDLIAAQQGLPTVNEEVRSHLNGLTTETNQNNLATKAAQRELNNREGMIRSKFSTAVQEMTKNGPRTISPAPTHWIEPGKDSILGNYEQFKRGNVILSSPNDHYEIQKQEFDMARLHQNAGEGISSARILDRSNTRSKYRSGNSPELDRLKSQNLSSKAADYFQIDSDSSDFFGHEVVKVANELVSYERFHRLPSVGMLAFFSIKNALDLKNTQNTLGFLRQIENTWAIVDYLKGFTTGVVQTIYDGVAGTYEMIRHPIDTFNNLVDAISNYDKVWDLIITKFGDTIGNYGSLSIEEKAELHGRIVTEIASMFVGVGVVKRVADVAKISKYVRLAVGKTVGVVDSARDVINAMGGKKFGKILRIPKGSRPKPESYLPEEYITKHLRSFEQGASFLVPKGVLDRYGRDLIGRPDNAQFVMSKTELDDLLTQSRGDIAEIEKALGIPDGQWQGRDVVRIDIPNPNEVNIRMPDGNEAGANELWLPGGKTPGGNKEAVVNQIPAGKYTESDL